MTSTVDEGTISSLVSSYQDSLTQVSLKALGSQIAIMTAISVGTILAFSFFRPREKKVYQPKIKYQLPQPQNPLDDPDYEPPPPLISNGFFAWLSPVIHLKEEGMIAQIGLDAIAFLRFLRLLRTIFTIVSVYGLALIGVYVAFNVKNKGTTNIMSYMTIQNVTGNWAWPALAVSYLINFTVMYFVYINWQAMIVLRNRWFRSPAYQTKIYSRTLMVTQIRKDYRTDEGLVALMGLLKVDGIKIGPELDCTSIGRRLEDFPDMVESHNQAVQDLEAVLVKYLKGGKMASKRPTLKKGGFLGIGGEKKDAIDYHAKEIKFLREKIDAKRQAIDSLIKSERRQRNGRHQKTVKVQGENYGFVTFKTISEAHRIARTHQGKQKELFGARLQLAPMPQDIVWNNISKEPSQIATNRALGFIAIGLVCFFNTIPLLVVSLLANLSSLAVYVTFLETWKDDGDWGNWTFSLVSGVLPSVVSFIFGFLLPVTMRRISKYQGAQTRSRLDRAVTARYFFFMIISNLIIFSLLSVVYTTITSVVLKAGEHESASKILNSLTDLPNQIQTSYVQESTYWLTWLPLRGSLIIFELLQLLKLALVSVRRVMFSYTPRDIRELTKPGYFEYSIVIVNLLFVAAIGLIYAPLAPLVVIGACIVFWFSSIVYKYQLLYVFVSRAESGGRMWNVYVNRLLWCTVFMQLLMMLTTALIRRKWLDIIAAAPPVLIMFAFKVYISRTTERKFRYYEPSAEEAEQERMGAMSEKRTRHSEMERRFLHPALQHDKLFAVMVHKSQEGLARDVLSAYPWFAGKHEHDGLQIKAVKEENLEYDPARDGPADEAHQAEWDARSIASTEMLGGKSEFATPSLDTEAYRQYPFASQGSPGASHSDLHLPMPDENPSTDYLLQDQSYQQQQRARKPSKRSYGYMRNDPDPVATSPLLDRPPQEGYVPYPPSAYAQPPIGYTPPTMRRTATDRSDGYETRWDAGQGQDIGEEGYAAADLGQRAYQDPYDAWQAEQQRSRRGGNGNGDADGNESAASSMGRKPPSYGW
ncbi:calcium permeable stress-gated cation channel, partial [Tremellales sp. Uapishka_1]